MLEQFDELTTCHCFDDFSTTIKAGAEIGTSTWTLCLKETTKGDECMISCDPDEMQAKGDNQPGTKKQKRARIVPKKLPKRPKLPWNTKQIPLRVE
jgi:hypothetical protein